MRQRIAVHFRFTCIKLRWNKHRALLQEFVTVMQTQGEGFALLSSRD